MQFDRLRLSGFKSFVDPAELVIAPGLTGVVGPNGCGKSNLLEALRWVMGESRPTAMRGGGMEDVIFAGTDRRPPRGFAEVQLHLDNANRTAPAAFNVADRIEVVRRITRDAGSAYRIDGRDVRARDVAMLFADAATGAHSPALVRQGQIGELISSKPRQRRHVLEEAAGIGGLHQRRHEAELKLRAAEANLARVDDVLAGLASGLAQLERQARQAERYRSIGAELRLAEAMLLWRKWQDADAARDAAEAELRAAVAFAAQSEATASAAMRERAAAEAALPPLREEAAVAGALLQRIAVEGEALQAKSEEALAALSAATDRLAQIERDAEREAALAGDAEETAAQLAEERLALETAEAGQDEALTRARAAASEAAAAQAAAEALETAAGEAAARLVARHASSRRALEAAEAAVERSAHALAAARGALPEAEERLRTAKDARNEAGGVRADAETEVSAAEAALSVAETARAASREQEAGARAARAEAEGRAATLVAEVSALARIAEEDGAGSSILDGIEAEPGFERALAAALGDDLAAPLAEKPGAAGWRELDSLPEADLPGPPLTRHVSAPTALSRSLGRIGIICRTQGDALQARLRPGERLVSREGDLWRWDGLHRPATAATAAALALERRNRLAALRAEAAAAEKHVDGARSRHEAAANDLREVTEVEERARTTVRSAEKARADALLAEGRAAAGADMAASRLETARLTLQRLEAEAEAAEVELKAAREARRKLGSEDEARRAADAARSALREAREAATESKARALALASEGEARRARIAVIDREAARWRQRVEQAGPRAEELRRRRIRAEAALERAKALPDEIAGRRSVLSQELSRGREREARAADALAAAEAALRLAADAERTSERKASEAREARAGATARADAARTGSEAAEAAIREKAGTGPDGLLDVIGRTGAEIPPSADLEIEVAALLRRRDALGAVNLRAEEDARTTREEIEALAREKADLDEAINRLRGAIGALNREGRQKLLAAFEVVNHSFGSLFRHLFGGGEARLELVDSDDPLEAGLEILCQPPGKRLAALTLLSGGEQTLTAMALIFAVFLSNPAPICVLDEVDAPLDDANVTRFCDLLEEMRRRTATRFLVITHHAITMGRMDRLYGVTMGEPGVSQLVSVDLGQAERMVA